MWMCLLVGMACSAPSEVAATPQPSLPSPEAVMPFSCSDAPAALGHPDATVTVCSEMVALPGVYSVMLDAGAAGYVSRVVVTDASGEVVEPGPGRAAAFLRRHQVATRSEVELGPLVHALHALHALPPDYGPDQISTSAPELGASSLTRDPLRLVLLRRMVATGGPPAGRGAPRFERAVLHGVDGPWHLERRDGAAWVPVSLWGLP